LPDATVDAFSDHGTLTQTITQGVDRAHEEWQKLGSVGIDVSDVAAKLEREGVASFQKSFDELIYVLAQKAAELS
jgi:transaldolase